MKCFRCGYHGLMKIRVNYPFGKKSKSRTTITCPNCNTSR